MQEMLQTLMKQNKELVSKNKMLTKDKNTLVNQRKEELPPIEKRVTELAASKVKRSLAAKRKAEMASSPCCTICKKSKVSQAILFCLFFVLRTRPQKTPLQIKRKR